MGGGDIHDIMEIVEDEIYGEEGGVILIHGGWNKLEEMSAEEVWDRMEWGLRKLFSNNMN